MTSRKPYPVDEATLKTLRSQLAAAPSPGDCVANLRSAGFDKIDSIKFFREFAGMPLHEGKALVQLSPAWADRYASDEAFHDAAEEAAKIIFQEEFTAA